MGPTPHRHGVDAGDAVRAFEFARQRRRGLGSKRAGVDRDTDETGRRVGKPRRSEIGLDAGRDFGQRVVGQATGMASRRLVAQHQCVRLGAMQQAQAHPCVGGVEQRSLAFDHVPVVRRGVRGQPLGGSRDEVRHHGVNRDPASGDENAGLTGGPEIGVDAAAPHLALDRQRRVHLTARAIGADGQQAPSRPLGPGAGLERRGWLANVEQSTAGALGGGVHTGDVGESRMQTAGHVEAVIEGVDDGRGPVFLHETALVGDAQDQRAGAALRGFGRRHLLEADVGLAAVEADLADAPLRPPGGDTARGLGCQRVARVTQEQQVRGFDHHSRRASLLCSASRRARSADSAAAYSALAHTRSSPAA